MSELSMLELVRRDLISRGFKVRSGVKYGANFSIYEGNTNDLHSSFLLLHLRSSEITTTEICKYNRVAASVNKEMIFTYFSDGELKYIGSLRGNV